VNNKLYEVEDELYGSGHASESAESAHDLEYTRSELKKPQIERWIPPDGTKLAKELYGSRMGDTAFVIGCGASLKKAEKYLKEAVAGSFRITLNRAVRYVPSEYWLFIDPESYFACKKHPHAEKATALGVDRFWRMYGPEVHIWQRAYNPVDFKAGRLIHRACSLLPALHMAVWLGAQRIVTVGCDNVLTDSHDIDQKTKSVYTALFRRINKSLMHDIGYWLPSWVTMADASGGSLALPKTTLGKELKALNAPIQAL
jgi:hypothetical protein